MNFTNEYPRPYIASVKDLDCLILVISLARTPDNIRMSISGSLYKSSASLDLVCAADKKRIESSITEHPQRPESPSWLATIFRTAYSLQSKIQPSTSVMVVFSDADKFEAIDWRVNGAYLLPSAQAAVLYLTTIFSNALLLSARKLSFYETDLGDPFGSQLLLEAIQKATIKQKGLIAEAERDHLNEGLSSSYPSLRSLETTAGDQKSE